MMNFSLLEANPAVLGGKPCIKGTRISVEFILELMASGSSVDDIVNAYPHLPKEAVQQAILYAAQMNKNEILLHIKAVA